MKKFVWRKGNRTPKGDKLTISRIVRESESCMSPIVLEEESTYMCTPVNHNSFNTHTLNENTVALLEAERKKAKALMEWQHRPFLC